MHINTLRYPDRGVLNCKTNLQDNLEILSNKLKFLKEKIKLCSSISLKPTIGITVLQENAAQKRRVITEITLNASEIKSFIVEKK